MPKVKQFLKVLFPERGGYKSTQGKSKGDDVEIVWSRGVDPRFEVVDSSTDKVIETIPLVQQSEKDIEEMLAKRGYVPRNR